MSFRINNREIVNSSRVLSSNELKLSSGGSLVVSEIGGTVYGYNSGGVTSPASINTIDKFPFATDAHATNVGVITGKRYGSGGNSSSTNGYSLGGFDLETSLTLNAIDRFPFAVNANATDIGDLRSTNRLGASQSSTVSGYISGGSGLYPTNSVQIDKFPFASNSTITVNVGSLSQGRIYSAGHSSRVSGYTSGGQSWPSGPPRSNRIDKFPFASNSSASFVGYLSTEKANGIAGQSSDVAGYSSGGYTPTLASNTIEKFSFASDGDASNIGNLYIGRAELSGQSSTVAGYSSGGFSPSPSGYTNVIDKFPFATDAGSTDVGDLSGSPRGLTAGHQI